jgi:hypothetical protein
LNHSPAHPGGFWWDGNLALTPSTAGLSPPHKKKEKTVIKGFVMARFYVPITPALATDYRGKGRRITSPRPTWAV